MKKSFPKFEKKRKFSNDYITFSQKYDSIMTGGWTGYTDGTLDWWAKLYQLHHVSVPGERAPFQTVV